MSDKVQENLNSAGWGYPLLARKGHYYQKGQALPLCGKWLFTGVRYVETESKSAHCATCTKKLKGGK